MPKISNKTKIPILKFKRKSIYETNQKVEVDKHLNLKIFLRLENLSFL